MSGCVCISSGSEDDLQMALAYWTTFSGCRRQQQCLQSESSHILKLFVYLFKCLQYYSGGVYSSTQCSSSYLTHAMLVTGYGTYNGVDYYLVKNRQVLVSCLIIILYALSITNNYILQKNTIKVLGIPKA